MRGYLNRPDATHAMIDAGGWLHTGDIGSVDAQGRCFVVDRIKELIKVNAYQVVPAELEAVLLSHPAVARRGGDRRAGCGPRGDPQGVHRHAQRGERR